MRFEDRATIVSVVIPCLNEEDAIPGVVREVLAEGADEIIVVDNGSTDATAARAREAGARVVGEPRRGYGRACAAGVAAVRPDAGIVCFLDGDGSDVPSFLAEVVGPVALGEADFVMGSRLRGRRESGSMTPQQLVAGRLAGFLMRIIYGVRFTDMSPFRAIDAAKLRSLGMHEQTYGWNLEMQMRAAACLRIREVPVDHRCRRGGVSKVSGNVVAGLSAAWKIATTFLRLAITLRRSEGGVKLWPHGRSAPPHSPSKTGVNALMVGEGWGAGAHTQSGVPAKPPPDALRASTSPTRGEVTRGTSHASQSDSETGGSKSR